MDRIAEWTRAWLSSSGGKQGHLRGRPQGSALHGVIVGSILPSSAACASKQVRTESPAPAPQATARLDDTSTNARAGTAGEARFAAAGRPAPPAPQVEATLPSVEALLDRVRDDVARLAGADMRNIRALTASALISLANLADAVRGDNVPEGLAEMRFQAERLRRSGSSSFARTGWVEHALVTALDALDAWQPCPSEAIRKWSAVAREAVTSIPNRSTLAFEHARLQDAFRTTADAFGMAVVQAQTCPSGRDPRGRSWRSEAHAN